MDARGAGNSNGHIAGTSPVLEPGSGACSLVGCVFFRGVMISSCSGLQPQNTTTPGQVRSLSITPIYISGDSDSTTPTWDDPLWLR